MSLAKSTGKTLAALTGAAMFASALVAPASAMSLPTPSGAEEIGAPVQQIWWDRWGYWHPDRHRVYHRRYMRCWIGPWGHRHCSWGYAQPFYRY
jgi:hypothetical protein